MNVVFLISHRPTQTHTDLLFGRPAVAKAMAGQALAEQKVSSRCAGENKLSVSVRVGLAAATCPVEVLTKTEALCEDGCRPWSRPKCTPI